MKQNPFSLYDFLGYLVPGAVFLLGIVLLRRIGQGPETWTAFLTPINTLGRVELFIPLIILAYITGHVLSYMSSITVEKYSIWTLGYPSQYLLGRKAAPFWSPPETVRPRRAVRFLVGTLLAPLSLLEMLTHWLGFRPLYAKPLDKFLITCIMTHVNMFGRSRYGHIQVPETSPDGDHDYFRVVYHYAVENAQAHVPKMQNYVALYGFARTITLEAVVFVWLALVFLVTGRYASSMFVVTAGGLALGSLFFYFDFNKFYRKFTLEAFMALLVSWQPPRSGDA